MSTAVDVDLNTVAELAAALRVDSIRSSTSAGSGHPTSSMSAADLVAVLVARHFHYGWDNPSLPAQVSVSLERPRVWPALQPTQVRTTGTMGGKSCDAAENDGRSGHRQEVRQ
jgi:transketolase